MDVHQLEIKLFARPGAEAIDPEAYIGIFHRWIQEDRLGKELLLIDVADYRHVPDGPGVMIIAHGAHWKVDAVGGQVGLAFARKRDPIGPAADKLVDALTWALRAATALEKEPALGGKLAFRGDRVRVAVVSRLVAGNRAEDAAALRPALEGLAQRLWPGAPVDIAPIEDPRGPLAVELRASVDEPASALLARLA